VWYAGLLRSIQQHHPAEEHTMANQKPEQAEPQHDDSDADAFAILSLLVIAAATIVYYLTH
jgi:hypothetical protein